MTGDGCSQCGMNTVYERDGVWACDLCERDDTRVPPEKLSQFKKWHGRWQRFRLRRSGVLID